MAWSIFKDSSSSNADEWLPNYAAWYYDYDVDTNFAPNRIKFLHDGPVEIFYKWSGREFSKVVEVKDGKWDRDTIEQDMLDLVKQTGYWGVFVEMFTKEKGKIYVGIGS